MFDILDNLVPMIIMFMLLRGILDVLLGKKKRRPEDAEQELPPDYESEPQQPDYNATPSPQPEQKGKPDLAAEFERRLKKRTLEQSQQGTRGSSVCARISKGCIMMARSTMKLRAGFIVIMKH